MPARKPTATAPTASPSGFSCATLFGALGLMLDLVGIRRLVADGLAGADEALLGR